MEVLSQPGKALADIQDAKGRLESKVALSLKNAWRLDVAMNNLINSYEAANGIIELAPDKDRGRKQ